MKPIRELVSEYLKNHSEEILADVQAFARIHSVSRSDLAEDGAPFGPECKTMLDFALNRAGELGFETQNHEGYCGSAILGDGENCIGIIGHLDVVPEGDKWIYPPYAATREGDFLIGRGVSDNKSAAVMGLHLMKFFRDNGIELKHGIRVLLGCSEETGMQDLHYYVQHYPEPLLTLVPDASFPVNYAQKGSMSGKMLMELGDQIAFFTGGEVANMVPPYAQAQLIGITPAQAEPFFGKEFDVEEGEGGAKIVAHGVASHAAHPEGGKSAIHMLADALSASGLLSGQSLKAMEAVRDMTSDYYGGNAGIAMEDPDTGKTTMVCGVAKMTKTGRMSLSLDCRLSLAADHEANMASFRAYAESLGFTVKRLETTPPVYMPKDDPRVVTMSKLYAEITGEYLEPYTMGGGTYSRELTRSLTFGLGFPGMTARPENLPEGHGGAHGPDEYLYIPNYLKAFEVYACVVKALDDLL